MIRAAIEDYFTPDDTTRFDHKLARRSCGSVPCRSGPASCWTRASMPCSTTSSWTRSSSIARSCCGRRPSRAGRRRPSTSPGAGTGTRSGSNRSPATAACSSTCHWGTTGSRSPCRAAGRAAARRRRRGWRAARRGAAAAGRGRRSRPVGHAFLRLGCRRRGRSHPDGRRDGRGRRRDPGQRAVRDLAGGAFRGPLELSVDGRRVARLRHQLNHDGQYTRLTELDLASGTHSLELRYGGPHPPPGSGGAQFAMGPLVLSTTTANVPVTDGAVTGRSLAVRQVARLGGGASRLDERPRLRGRAAP